MNIETDINKMNLKDANLHKMKIEAMAAACWECRRACRRILVFSGGSAFREPAFGDEMPSWSDIPERTREDVRARMRLLLSGFNPPGNRLGDDCALEIARALGLTVLHNASLDAVEKK